MAGHSDLSAVQYLRLPQVIARVRDFCGLIPAAQSHSVYVIGMGLADGPQVTWGHVSPKAPGELTELMARGDDVARSLWDTGNLLVYVDLDYMNSDAPGEAFLHPADVFVKLEPTYRGLCELFDGFGMPMLDLVTGAGYSFIGQVALRGPAAVRLRSLTPDVPSWHATHAQRAPSWADARIEEDEAKAYHGLGLVLEHLAHRILSRVSPVTALPLVVNNTEVGPGLMGRECVSIDLTHMGDPLDSRHLRVPFALYQKHRLRPDLVGTAAARMPPLAVVPRGRRPLLEILDRGREPARAAEQATRAHTTIPAVEEGLLRMLDDYAASGLAEWHRSYYSVRPHPPAAWPDTYGRFDPAGLPPCAAACLQWPNDLLLKPAHIQHLVRILLARGWHARHVAGLVLAHYSRADIWGDHWRRCDPATRADYDVRVFAGLVADGCDQGVDFNCVSTQEKRMCPGPGCNVDLRRERDHMLARTYS